MKLLLLLLFITSHLFSKDFSIIIDKPFNNVLLGITQDYDRSLSAIGFSKSHEKANSNKQQAYTNAFDYLSSLSNSTGSRMHLIKMDKGANIALNKISNFSEFNEAVSIIKTPQNGYFVGGYTKAGSLLIHKLDVHANKIFTKRFGTSNNNKMNKLVALKDGGVLSVGYSTTTRSTSDDVFESGLGLSDIYLARFTKDGRELWSKKFGTKNDDRAIDAVEADDGSLIVLSSTDAKNSKNVSISRITENGNKIWMMHYKKTNKITPNKIIKLRDNNFLISLSQENDINKKQVRLIKFNLQKDILLDKQIYTSYSSVLKDIKEYSNGNIIGVGHVQDTYNTDALVMVLDSSLNMLHQEHYGGENRDMFNAVTILHNSQAAAVGINTSEHSQESNMWITKLNKDATMAQVSLKTEKLYKQLLHTFKEEIATGKLKIHEDLSINFTANNLLFQAGKYKLTKAQIKFINSFSKKLIPLLYTYRQMISALEINGHSSSEWSGTSFTNTYLNNEKLSMGRSYETLTQIFKQQSKPTQIWLTKVLKGTGFASSKRIQFNNIESKKLSRRVEFKILLAQ